MKRLVKLLTVLLLTLTMGMVFAGGDQEAVSDNGDAATSLAASLALEDAVLALEAADGQPLLRIGGNTRTVPQRPSDPSALPETDPLHWWDMEFAGEISNKTNIPDSPADGAIGKKVIMIVHGDHPWTTACTNGAQKVADVYGMELKIQSPNWDLAVQNQMIDQAINENPDMILLIPLDAKTAPQQARKINRAGVPLILFNTLPDAAAMDYAISWTGPDDFGQFRKLSRLWADALGKEGGVAYVQHAPGGSPYFARCFGPVSELAEYAPDIEVLDMQAPGFEADKTMQLVSDWLTRFGDDLKGICAADDSAQALGIFEALKKAGREDVIVIAAGNSKVGMDLVSEGKLYAITYQTAEGDGALAVKTAADWFNGKEIEAIRNLPQHMITAEDVASFYPPQW
ncbi:MAG: sugar ABC transporter substrate-binding protein [Spirochaetales bacterium]|nr:sugar ABC transporter substrate-binding protein [Spirochaetales bacterium]